MTCCASGTGCSANSSKGHRASPAEHVCYTTPSPSSTANANAATTSTAGTSNSHPRRSSSARQTHTIHTATRRYPITAPVVLSIISHTLSHTRTFVLQRHQTTHTPRTAMYSTRVLYFTYMRQNATRGARTPYAGVGSAATCRRCPAGGGRSWCCQGLGPPRLTAPLRCLRVVGPHKRRHSTAQDLFRHMGDQARPARQESNLQHPILEIGALPIGATDWNN